MLVIFCEGLLTTLVLQDLKNQLNARGAKTIRGLGRVFRNMDSFDGNKRLDRSEFFSGLCEVQCKITQEDADVTSSPISNLPKILLNFLDKTHDGCIDMSEFLVGVRGTPNQRR